MDWLGSAGEVRACSGGRAMRQMIVLLGIFVCALTGTAQAHEFEIQTRQCARERQWANEAVESVRDPFLRDAHRALMLNELNDGCGAYQFIDADMDSRRNGFSFGLSQFDLTQRDGSLEVLQAIIGCASRELRTQLLTDRQLRLLEESGRIPTSHLRGHSADWGQFVEMRAPIERALSSECGRARLAAEYRAELTQFNAAVRVWWAAIEPYNPQAATQGHLFRLLLLDYRNVNGPPVEFQAALPGRETPACLRLCRAGVLEEYRVGSEATVTDLLRYWLEYTCYGAMPQDTRRPDALRRVDNILGLVDLGSISLTAQDRDWLRDYLSPIVASAVSPRRARAVYPNIVAWLRTVDAQVSDRPGYGFSEDELRRATAACAR